MKEPTYLCPECDSVNVLVYEQTSFWVNSGKYFCNSVRQSDGDAQCRCTECKWVGERKDLWERK